MEICKGGKWVADIICGTYQNNIFTPITTRASAKEFPLGGQSTMPLIKGSTRVTTIYAILYPHFYEQSNLVLTLVCLKVGSAYRGVSLERYVVVWVDMKINLD